MRNQFGAMRFRKDSLMVVFVAVLVSAGGLVVLSGPAAAQGTASSSTLNVGSVNVSIKNYAFNPGNITVVLGVNNTVIWTNNDSVTHAVVALGGSFNTTQPPNDTFTHTFTAPGAYNYHCTIHTFMKGAVIVLAGPTTVSTSSATSNTTSTPAQTAVPEFPFGALAVVITTVLLVASYIVIRQTKRG